MRFSLTSNTRVFLIVCFYFKSPIPCLQIVFFSVGITVIIKSNQLSSQSEQTDFYCVPAHLLLLLFAIRVSVCLRENGFFTIRFRLAPANYVNDDIYNIGIINMDVSFKHICDYEQFCVTIA